jgi:Glycosyltransferase
MPFSIHTVRWIKLLKEQNWEIHFFSSFPYAVPNKEFPGIIYHDFFYNIKKQYPQNLDYKDLSNRKIIFKNERVNKWIGKGFRFLRLQKKYQVYLDELILKIKPDIIHSMESQHAGYMVNDFYTATKLKPVDRPKWIHSTWGLDIDYFQHFPDHLQKLKAMFSNIDIYLSEGQRDVKYARMLLGYKNKTLIFPSVAGGYEIEVYPKPILQTSKRKKILIKGEQDSVRRGLHALRGLVRCKDVINGYDVVVYSAAKEVKDYIQYINSKENLQIKLFTSGTYNDWMNLLAETRISINNNLSDGNPSSLFEAMLMGAFPIQSRNSCADEWVKDGVSAILTSPEDAENIEKAIREALSNDVLVEEAAAINYNKICTSLSFNKIQQEVIKLYTDAVSENVNN